MPQPFDYRLNVPDPVSQVLSGVQTGQNLRAAREQRAAAEVAKQKQADFQAASAALGPGSTADEYAEVARMLPPDQQKAFLETFSLLSTEQKANKLAFSSQLLSATISSPDVAANMAREQAIAERNGGNEEAAKAWDTTAQVIEVDPEGAFHAMAVMISGLEGGPDAVKAALDAQKAIIGERETEAEIEAIKGEEEREAGLHLLDKEKAQAQIDKLKAERDKIYAELEGVGKLTPPEISKGEDSLKEYYTKKTKSYQEGQRQLSNMKISAKDRSGPGDIALVRSFLLMLEPTSVVRESEFATAADSQGLVRKITVIKDKLVAGDILSDTARANFLDLANKFLKHGKQVAEQEFWSAHDISKRRGLNKKNIFTNKDLTLFAKKGRPNPDDYKFGDEDVAKVITFLDEVGEELGATTDVSDYTKFRSFKED